MRALYTSVLVVVVALVFVPVGAHAQDDAPPPPPPIEELDATDTEAEPTQEDAEATAVDEKDSDQRVDRFTVGRAGIEVLTGFGMMVGGTLTGLLTGFLVGSLVTTPGSVETGVATAIGGVGGYVAGTPVGIWLGGNAMNGNGSIWATLGGTAAGILVGGSASVIISASTGGTGGAEFWMIAMPITGGIVGYELTSGPPTDAQKGASIRLGVSPSMRGRGTTLNLTGRW
jgi:hypothetical protein